MFKMTASFKVGQNEYTIEAEESKEMDTLHKVLALSNPRKKCNLCDNYDWFKMASNKDKDGNVYVNVICKCGAASKLGQYKSGGYFWHEFEMYKKSGVSKAKETFDATITDDSMETPF